MKVLFVDHESNLGGAEISMINIVRAMPDHKVSYYVAIAGPGALQEALKKAGAKVWFERMDGWRWWEKGLKKRIKLFLSFPLQMVNIIKWMRLIKQIKPDIVHFNLSRLVEPVIAARLLGIPTVMHCREHQVNSVTFFGGLRFHAVLLNQCSFWIYNSVSTRDSLEKYRDNSTGHATILNGIPIEEFMEKSSAPIKWRRKDSEKIILMAATLVPWKNHIFAIELAKKVIEKYSDVLFVFAGTGNDHYLRSLRQLVEEKGIAENVIFPGFISNSVALFQSTDILLHTSVKESFGRVYAEAMAAAIPVVALSGAAAEEVVKHGQGGYLFNENQIELMSDKIVELLQNETLRKKQGLIGQKRVKALFSIDLHCDRIYEVYKIISNKNKS